jgi:2-(1,2-epoxy-1,2-dihydrophenyl)acetyl-CoA isomerase
MAETPILVEARAGYRIITLNRPARPMPSPKPCTRRCGQVLAEVEADSDCRALITGAG